MATPSSLGARRIACALVRGVPRRRATARAVSRAGVPIGVRALHASCRHDAPNTPRRTRTSSYSAPSATVIEEDLPWFSSSTPQHELVARTNQEDVFASSDETHQVEGETVSDSLPWFEEDPIVQGRPVPQDQFLPVSAFEFRDGSSYDQVPRPSVLTGMDVPNQEAVQYLLPDQLVDLYDVLICGPPSHLVAPLSLPSPSPSPSGSEASAPAQDQRPAIRFIHVPSLSTDDPSKHDWVVIVEARSSNQQEISRLALSIGQFLERTNPPQTTLQRAEEIHRTMSPTPVTKQNMMEALDNLFKNPVGNYYGPHKHEEERESKESKGTAWRPTRVLSRVSREGIKMLHKADPDMFTVEHLSSAFKISQIAVRKILRSKWQPSEQEAEKQDRRLSNRRGMAEASKPEARKMMMQRLKQALLQQERQPLSSNSSLLGDTLINGFSGKTRHLVEGIKRETKREAFDRHREERYGQQVKAPKPKQVVKYEGLNASEPSSSCAGPAGPAGPWAMVDANWCQVHVVSPEARKQLQVEQQWEQQAAGVVHHNLYGQPDVAFPAPALEALSLPKLESYSDAPSKLPRSAEHLTSSKPKRDTHSGDRSKIKSSTKSGKPPKSFAVKSNKSTVSMPKFGKTDKSEGRSRSQDKLNKNKKPSRSAPEKSSI